MNRVHGSAEATPGQIAFELGSKYIDNIDVDPLQCCVSGAALQCIVYTQQLYKISFAWCGDLIAASAEVEQCSQSMLQ